MSTADTSKLAGYRSIGDVTFDLGNELTAEIGWVLFEVSGGQAQRVQGAVVTYNNYATLKLVKFERTQRPCHICGWFDDGVAEPRRYMLNDVVFTALLVRDVSGFIGFRADAVGVIA